MDNNTAERALRAVCLGKKISVCRKNPDWAKRSAMY
ncbi:IS66 family transposase [Escherichia coli]